MQKVLLVLAFASLLAACQNKPQVGTQLVKVRCNVPANLLTCEARSKKPAPTEQITDDQAGRFIVDNDDAGQDCREKLAAVADVLKACESKQ